MSMQAPQLTHEQQAAIFNAAAEHLAAAVEKRPANIAEPTLAGAAKTQVMGCFVTAKRNAQLRSCCGFMGAMSPISEAIKRAAQRTANDDHRFPPISPGEIPHLHLDAWLLFDLQPVVARGEARRNAITIGLHGLQIIRGNRRGLLLPGVATEHDLNVDEFLQHTCIKAGLPPHAWMDDDVQLFTFAGVAIEGDMPQRQHFNGIRPAAVAGTFYPGSAARLHQLLDQLLSGPTVEKKCYPAIMVPHAGLKYSGQIAADVFRRTELPSTVIVIGPKHTPDGIDWAIAPHEKWSIPGSEIENDLEVARELVAAIPELEFDATAHAREHAIEVELPFIARLSPGTKVVGIAVGRGDYAFCKQFAHHLADVLRRQTEMPLLVISSDMNHFASDAENRRLDELALSCIDRLDAEALLTTCRTQHISMCGVVPTVIVMETLRNLGLLQQARRISYATSGEISRDTSRVVGYAGMVFE